MVGLRVKGLEGLYVERLPLYRRYADVTVDVTGLGYRAVVDRVLDAVSKVAGAPKTR